MSQHHLQFLGAANTVTGSRYLLSSDHKRYLIDCGLFQGYKYIRQRNWQPFPADASKIEAVILTHAHLDHCGYLPVLVGLGFTGPIYCSAGTRDLAEIILLDAAHIQEEEAEFLNRHKITKHHPAQPLFTQSQARKALKQFQVLAERERHQFGPLTLELIPNGHILGSTCVALELDGKRLLFSGDLGRPDDPIMHAPEPPPATDVLVIESTYGDRDHSPVNTEEQLADIVRETARRGGTVLIPAFAVGRAQLLTWMLHRLVKSHTIPSLPIYLDSPMAIKASELLGRHPHLHRLSRQECNALEQHVHYTRTVEQSMALANMSVPKVIISASGMATGGRVLHHLKHLLGDNRNSVIFAGYQAGGTRGARLVNGEPNIKIHGQYWPVKASIHSLDNLSAHADRNELLDWLRKLPVAPKQIFITHGEPEAADHLRIMIQDELGWQATVPDHKERFELD